MKKYFFIVFILTTGAIQAQKLSLGVEGGGNVTAVRTTYIYQGAYKTAPWFGYYLGVYGKYKLNDKKSNETPRRKQRGI